MRQIVATAVITIGIFATSSVGGLAQSAPPDGRETLTRALRGAWLPLESGLAVSAREGTPLSAKYEIDDGAFQLSVYTWKVDAASGDSFSEVIVDHNIGTVSKVEAITDGGDLAAARSQKAAMAAGSGNSDGTLSGNSGGSPRALSPRSSRGRRRMGATPRKGRSDRRHDPA